MGKPQFSFRRTGSRERLKKPAAYLPVQRPPPDVELAHVDLNMSLLLGTSTGAQPSKTKKAGGSRMWMRFNEFGHSELLECDRGEIIDRTSIPPRDLRILGPLFSHSSNILGREKAVVINLEFIKAIVTAEEVLLVDPTAEGVLRFIHELRRQLPARAAAPPLPPQEEDALPFELQVLEIALQVICAFLDSSVAGLEREAYPVLDELARDVSTKNLELVRTLKSNLTRLLARVQKVRDEIEHLLDDDEDMAELYLTRKRTGSVQEADVDDLEMLLEAYFTQLDGTRNKILSVREYVDDTEDYVNIQLDNQRNELIQLQLIITIASFAVTVETLVAGLFGMNIPCTLYKLHGIFGRFVASITAASVVLFFLVLAYARWKKLIDS